MTAQRETDTAFPEMDTPEFRAKADALIKAEQAKFDAWMAESDMSAHVDLALQAGRAALAAAADLPDDPKQQVTWIEIDLDHRRAKPLVMALASAGVGEAEIWNSYTWDIAFRHIRGRSTKKTRGVNYAQMHAALEAFALALSKPGFELRISRE